MTAKDKAAWEADGSPSRWTLPGSAPDYTPVVITSKPGEEQVRITTPPQPRDAKAPAAVERRYELAGHPTTLAELNKLPTEPTALKQWLVKQLEKNEIYIANDHTLFQAGLDLVFRLPVTPQVRAAAYRMLADVKGVTSLGPVTDQRGRAGMAVASARKDDGGNWIQIRLIIDPQTGQALAEESWDLGSGKSPASAGELRRYTLLLSSGFSDDTPPAETGPRGR